MNNRIQYMKVVHQSNKERSIGSTCRCPSCGTAFTKEHYQQAFCKTKGGTICKDNYWNNVTPSKRNNKTRISPANARYYNDVILPNRAKELGFPDVETMRNHIDEGFDEQGGNVQVENCHCCGLRPEYCECGEGSGAEFDL